MFRNARGLLVSLFLLLPPGLSARDAYTAWDDRCEECHGESDVFSRKFLWSVDGLLQGQHHIDNLRQFLGNHYVPEHEVEALHELLLSQANDMARFANECGSCHVNAEEFVHSSIATRVSGMVGVQSGVAVGEYLQTHQNLSETDAEFFTRLITRVSDQISGATE